MHVEETEPWDQDGETWRVLRARFPGSIETHSRVQDFFFDDSRMLRRHDYQVNIAGGFPAAQLTSEHVVVMIASFRWAHSWTTALDGRTQRHLAHRRG